MNPTSSDSPSLRITVIDDMIELRKVLGHFITKTLYAEVAEAEDGLEAIERVLERAPDLIFCDLHMPRMTGFEFLGFLTRQQQQVVCPIIVLTSEEDEEARVQAAGFSVSAYLRKPFQPETVLKVLHAFVPEEHFQRTNGGENGS